MARATWATIDGEKYWFRPSGSTATGFATIDDGSKRYFDKEGRMAVGWRDINGKRYYFRTSGAMQTGSATIDGVDYKFSKSGVLSTSNLSVSVSTSPVSFGETATLVCSVNGATNDQGDGLPEGVARVAWQSSADGQKTWGACATGESRHMECVQINLSGYAMSFFDVYYRVHVADHGWLGWAKNGEMAGTTNGRKSMLFLMRDPILLR